MSKRTIIGLSAAALSGYFIGRVINQTMNAEETLPEKIGTGIAGTAYLFVSAKLIGDSISDWIMEEDEN